MNARESPRNLLMPFLISSDSHSMPHCLLPVTRVCLPRRANDSLVLSKTEGGGKASTGEPSLCFIASHCRVGRLRPSSPLLMGVGVLFLLQIYAWVGRCDLRSSDTVSAAGPERLIVALCVCSRWARGLLTIHAHTHAHSVSYMPWNSQNKSTQML